MQMKYFRKMEVTFFVTGILSGVILTYAKLVHSIIKSKTSGVKTVLHAFV